MSSVMRKDANNQGWLNGNDFGLVDDYSGIKVDNHKAFDDMFTYLYKDPLFDYKVFGPNRVSKYNIDIPKGVYTVKKPNIASIREDIRVSDIIINGNGSTILADGFEGSLFKLDDRFMYIEFRNIVFNSTNDGLLRTMFNTISTGGTQQLRFINCTFTGNWQWGMYLQGDDNNSEWSFDRCAFHGKWDSFLMIPNKANKGSDQFLNFWFNNCKYWTSYTWITARTGGHFKINHCDISIYEPTKTTYLYDLGDGYGTGGYGVQTFVDTASRYEMKTKGAKVMKCNWAMAQVVFDNVDFSSSTHINVGEREATFEFFTFWEPNLTQFYLFENCKILGKFLLHSKNQTNAELKIKNSTWYDSGSHERIEEFFNYDQEIPSTMIRTRLEDVRYKNQTVNRTLHSDKLNRVDFLSTTKKDNDMWNEFVLPEWRYKITKESTMIKSVIIKNRVNLGDGNNHKIGIRSLAGKVTSVNVKEGYIVVDNIDTFVSGNKITIGNNHGTVLQPSLIDAANKRIWVNLTGISVAVGNSVYHALVDLAFNPINGISIAMTEEIFLLNNDMFAVYYGSKPSQTRFKVDVLVEALE